MLGGIRYNQQLQALLCSAEAAYEWSSGGISCWAGGDIPVTERALCERVQHGMKRQAVGIWKCKACKKVQAGGAYTLKCALNHCDTVQLEVQYALFAQNERLPSYLLLLTRCLCCSTGASITVRSTIRRLREQIEV